MRPISLDKWVDSTRRLLDIERQEEIQVAQQELELLKDVENPNVLTNLRLEHWSTGLFGRIVLKLAFPSSHLQKPKPHQFTVGDLVQLRLKKQSSSSKKNAVEYPTGIVARVQETSISIAINDDQEIEEEELVSQALILDRLVNNATFLKMNSVLDQLAKFDYGHAQNVIDIVFNGKTPSWEVPLPKIQPFNQNLNESQLEAIQFALASKDLALIHGPPGTGKTTTIVELIMQAVLVFKMKVLVCAPSNIAVDNVLEKTAEAAAAAATTTTTTAGTRKKNEPIKLLSLTRIGHPARLLPQVLNHCLDARIQFAEGTQIVQDIRQEIIQLENQLKKFTSKQNRKEIFAKCKANRKEIRQREKKIVKEILFHQSDVIFATNIGACSKLFSSSSSSSLSFVFDLVIIDEAAQALEASCWIPILKGKKCILAGDHLQLPPTIQSQKAAKEGLNITLFDRLIKQQQQQQQQQEKEEQKLSSIIKMLTIQYRMHENICGWSSKAMYQGRLTSHSSVATRKLHDLNHVTMVFDDVHKEVLNATLLLIDTAGCDLQEEQQEKDLSKFNEGEAILVEKHVRDLFSIGLKQEEIAIITPYRQQVQCIKTKLTIQEFPKLEIRSVDGFQGCEKEAVVLSLVRSNDFKEIGFLQDDRRINVAITRAKRHVAIICDTETICGKFEQHESKKNGHTSHFFLQQLVAHFEKFGEYRSAQEYLDQEKIHVDFSQVKVTIPSKQIVTTTTNKSHHTTSTTTGHKKKKKKNTTRQIVSDVQSSIIIQENTAKEPIQTLEEELKDEEEKSLESSGGGNGNLFQLLPSDSEDSLDSDADMKEIESTSIQQAKAQEEANDLLKSLHLSRRMTRQIPFTSSFASIEESNNSTNSKKKKTQKKKKKNNGAASSTSIQKQQQQQEEEDELTFLNRQVSNSMKCSYQNMSISLHGATGPTHPTGTCKKSTKLLSGNVCICCKLQFCYEHIQPEVHGCGQARRQLERQQQTSSENTKQRLPKDKRKILQKKLQEKVQNQSKNRHHRSPSS